MSIISAFAGRYSALDFAYGVLPAGGPPLSVQTGNTATGAGSIVLVSGQSETTGGASSFPVTINTPITVGVGANAETVTPSGVTLGNLSGGVPGLTVTATFANIHGPLEPVTSGTFGLQEAINMAAANGSGEVVVTQAWYNAGGTLAMIQAAVLPSNGSVRIRDMVSGRILRNHSQFGHGRFGTGGSDVGDGGLTGWRGRNLDSGYRARSVHLRHCRRW